MNESHSALTDWGLSHVPIGKQFTILDVGCGGGATIRKLAMVASEGMVHGIDFALGSIATASSVNADLIAAGRVNIQKASVSRLPFSEAFFDLVTAVETQYYWPDLPGDMREILRVLKPGGILIVIAETYKGGRGDWWQRPIMKLLGSSHLDVTAHQGTIRHRSATKASRFSNIQKGMDLRHGTKTRVVFVILRSPRRPNGSPCAQVIAQGTHSRIANQDHRASRRQPLPLSARGKL